MQSDMKELKAITTEMKRIGAQLKTLKAKKEEIEGRILDYIQELPDKDKFTTITYKDLVVQLKEQPVIKKKTKKEIEEETIALLMEQMEIDKQEAQKIYTQMQEGMKPKVNEEHKVKLTVREEKKNEKIVVKKN